MGVSRPWNVQEKELKKQKRKPHKQNKPSCGAFWCLAFLYNRSGDHKNEQQRWACCHQRLLMGSKRSTSVQWRSLSGLGDAPAWEPPESDCIPSSWTRHELQLVWTPSLWDKRIRFALFVQEKLRASAQKPRKWLKFVMNQMVSD